jgi:single-stranded-DNA-specific exonuclease
MSLFDRILAARGIGAELKASFLLPDYSSAHDPYLLPDMGKAVKRLVGARRKQENITIYGDYDTDGLTASVLLTDAFSSFGFKNVETFIPNRFVEGYGLTVDAIEDIASRGANLVVTVDCGSLSEREIARANELGVDVIVTDHHNVAAVQPPAVAVINPKRVDSKYPFADLAGVGVAFKLIQALQAELDGLPIGQEKWLLDLVALGTVCDVVPLLGENRMFVYWGLKVMSQTRRLGIKALMAVSGIDPKLVNARSLGFGLGPRMNAAGRLETARHAYDMMISDDSMAVLEKAQYLDDLNTSRRLEQNKIFKEAIIQAEKYADDPVLVLSGADWNHGIVGIVAAKLLEKYQKPTFVLHEMGDIAKGSARSFGDFSAVAAIRASEDIITKGGGHELAAGVTLSTENIAAFRRCVNEYYESQKLVNQQALLLPREDTIAELDEITEEAISLISQLEPFGNGNPRPILKSNGLLVKNVRKMGENAQHVRLDLYGTSGRIMQFLAFNAPEYFFVEPGMRISVWYHPDVNEWRGSRSIEGRLLHLEISDSETS